VSGWLVASTLTQKTQTQQYDLAYLHGILKPELKFVKRTMQL